MVKLTSDQAYLKIGFPGGLVVKNLPPNAGDANLILGSGRCPEEGNGNPPTPVFLPGKSQQKRSLACYSPWVHKELDTS